MGFLARSRVTAISTNDSKAEYEILPSGEAGKHETSCSRKKKKAKRFSFSLSCSFSFGLGGFSPSGRIKNEWKDIRRDRNPPFHCSGGPIIAVRHRNYDDLFRWNGVIIGPSDCPFEGGVFFLSIVIPSDYPFKPPVIKFTTKVFHPNIDSSGNIQLPILTKNYWSPAFTIIKTLLAICSILTDPDTANHDSNPISAMYRSDRDQYDEIAREWTRRYAME